MLPVGIGRERAPCWWRVWEVLGICTLTLLCSSGSGIDGGDSGGTNIFKWINRRRTPDGLLTTKLSHQGAKLYFYHWWPEA